MHCPSYMIVIATGNKCEGNCFCPVLFVFFKNYFYILINFYPFKKNLINKFNLSF